MAVETLKVFDDRKNPIGILPREAVHKEGYWHETFHCWFIHREAGMDYVYLQIRSETKDFPHLLDITAAGHLLAHETVHDGVREIKEELGIDVSFAELVPLGTVKDRIVTEDFIDKEFTNVFLYFSHKTMHEYILQKEEVAGIVRAEFNHFYDLWYGKRDELAIRGFKMTEEGNKISIDENVGKNRFVPHELSYYESIVKLINKAAKRI